MNPQTREPIQIAASKSVKFTVGSKFKKLGQQSLVAE